MKLFKTYFGVIVTGKDFYYDSIPILSFPGGDSVAFLHKFWGKEISSHRHRQSFVIVLRWDATISDPKN